MAPARRRRVPVGERPPSVDEPTVSLESEAHRYERRLDRDAGNGRWDVLRGKLFHLLPSFDDAEPFADSFMLKLLSSVRIASAFYTVINDCDETYNYWEALHLMVYGRGFQTWEYSPVFAIRSWFYISLHYFPTLFLSFLLADSKVAVFYTLRVLLGFFHGAAEFMLTKAIAARLGNTISKFYFIITLTSVGTFYAGSAFLPSTFAMIMNMFALAFWLQERWFWSILSVATGALVGWPFAAVLGLPIVLEMVVLRRHQLFWTFVKYAAVAGSLVLSALYTVDSHYYGKHVIAPLNIVLYNVISGNGPELYGVEPFTYYLKNLVLNWSIALPFALVALPLALYVYIPSSIRPVVDEGKTKEIVERPTMTLAYWYRFMPIVLIGLAAFVWAFIFFSQPHKEERFLTPIYPHIAVLFAVALYALRTIIKDKFYVIPLSILLVFAVISTMRGAAVFRNYNGVVETHKQFYDHFVVFSEKKRDFTRFSDPIRVCTGKEWHRFPSSFFLPENSIDKHGNKRKVELEFIKSAFKGILPKHYPIAKRLSDVTRAIPDAMNDKNEEEPERYVPVETCDYILDFDDGTSGGPDEPNYAQRC
uniref:Mannosyltransferase n=1 Tax=Panagrellus redivivus TaxID=6233 RepID=A0A7E4W837_PANRE